MSARQDFTEWNLQFKIPDIKLGKSQAADVSGNSTDLYKTDTNVFVEALQEYLDKRARKTRHKKEARRRDEP